MRKQTYRILVVDDEAAVLFTYKLLLERQGYEATTLLTGKEAKLALDDSYFDLLLCDLSLEERESGFEVIEFARRKQPGMPSILLTGYASLEAMQKAEALRIPVLYKPIDVQEFLTTIPAILRETYEKVQAGTC